jgi:rod shape-determining protein MreD
MAGIVVFLMLLMAAFLQNSIVNQISMLYGSADLVLLVLVTWMLQTEERHYWIAGLMAGFLIGISTALPIWLPMLEYLLVVLLVTFLQRRVWQVPIWLLLTSTILSTLLIYGFELTYLTITGGLFDVVSVFNLLLLPSIVLNLILALPVFGVMGEIGKLLFPEKVEV